MVHLCSGLPRCLHLVRCSTAPGMERTRRLPIIRV
ncbi:hypothetical protein C8E08_2344 [Paracidovorax citrulli]|nr:hypothetical protein C8E08_2344 [Paracidovorax citrulli]